MLRDQTDYNMLLREFDVAVEKIWPSMAANNKCSYFLNNIEDIRAVMFTAFRLMCLIQKYLKKRNIDYEVAYKFPEIASALENAVTLTTTHQSPVAHEARALEQLSRAAFKWLKTYKALEFKNDASNSVNLSTRGRASGPFSEVGYPLDDDYDQEEVEKWHIVGGSWREEPTDMMFTGSRIK